MRELIPLRGLLQEVGNKLDLDFAKPVILHSTVFEDNNGTLSLATSPRMTPRTKHIAVKYHFFRSMIGPDKGICIQKIESAEQKADCFTKGLPDQTFQHIRKILQGW